MPAVSEFDDTLGVLGLCGRQLDGHPAMTDASTERSDPSTDAKFPVYRQTVLVTPKPDRAAKRLVSSAWKMNIGAFIGLDTAYDSIARGR